MATRTRLVMSIHSNEAIGTLQNILTDSSSRSRPFARKIINYFHALSAGAKSAAVFSGVVDESGVDPVSASLAGTFTGAATAADTVTINGVVLTAVSNGSTPTNNQFKVGTDATSVAANLTAAIMASTSDALAGVVRASSALGVVTVTCLIGGVIGNSISVSESSSAFSWAGAATALASGSGRLPILTSFSFGK